MRHREKSGLNVLLGVMGRGRYSGETGKDELLGEWEGIRKDQGDAGS